MNRVNNSINNGEIVSYSIAISCYAKSINSRQKNRATKGSLWYTKI